MKILKVTGSGTGKDYFVNLDNVNSITTSGDATIISFKEDDVLLIKESLKDIEFALKRSGF